MADEPELTEGANGEWVEYLQQWLNSLGFYQGVVDGEFGPVTQQAVTTAQQQYAIEDDGVVGAGTWQLVTLARTAGEAKAEVVWKDEQLDEIEAPEMTDQEGQGQEGEVTA